MIIKSFCMYIFNGFLMISFKGLVLICLFIRIFFISFGCYKIKRNVELFKVFLVFLMLRLFIIFLNVVLEIIMEI